MRGCMKALFFFLHISRVLQRVWLSTLVTSVDMNLCVLGGMRRLLSARCCGESQL